jgi:hypothetical protein
MKLHNEGELEATRAKLGMLEEQYQAAQNEPGENQRVQDLELRSLRRLINQLKEEIARYKAGVAVRADQ